MVILNHHKFLFQLLDETTNKHYMKSKETIPTFANLLQLVWKRKELKVILHYQIKIIN